MDRLDRLARLASVSEVGEIEVFCHSERYVRKILDCLSNVKVKIKMHKEGKIKMYKNCPR
ncbi:hypothetical protein XO09_04005 [Thermosipho sp. 1223]|nr:hypothetical protein [Thermosipho sp. 1244]OOC46931.1 hypothetical protein XO09_04005 [Thermosipho sp. 1223]